MSDNSISKKVTKQPVKVDLIKVSDYQKKGTKTAQLRQVIETTALYQAIQIENNMEQNIFSHEEFGAVAEPSEYKSTENRVCFLTIPETVTAEEVQKRLDENPDSCIYKVMSNHPILTTSQQYAIDNPELPVTLNKIANNQVVRYPKGHELEGNIIVDQNTGKVQYRATFFAKSHVEDIDRRNDDFEDVYKTPEIMVELGENIPDEEQFQNAEEQADSTGQNA